MFLNFMTEPESLSFIFPTKRLKISFKLLQAKINLSGDNHFESTTLFQIFYKLKIENY